MKGAVREPKFETPADVVYEALRTAFSLRGIEAISKRAEGGLRLIAEVTAEEVIKRAVARETAP